MALSSAKLWARFANCDKEILCEGDHSGANLTRTLPIPE